MILRFFNDKQLAVQIGIIIAFLAAMLNQNIEMQAPQAFGPVYEAIYQLLSVHPTLIFISFILLIVVEGILLQLIVLHYNLVARNNLIVILFWLILVFSNPSLVNFNPVLIATVLSTWALFKLFAISERENSIPKLFSVGFIISFSSLIYGLVFYYLIFLIISLFILSLVNFRQILVSFISFSLPYIYLFSYGYLFDVNIEFLSKVNFSIDKISFFNSGPLFWISISLTLIITVFSIYGLLKLISGLFSKLIQFRNFTTVLIVLLFISFVLQFLSGPWWYVHPYLIFVPLSILVSIYLSEQKRTFYIDLILGLIIFLEIFQLYYLKYA